MENEKKPKRNTRYGREERNKAGKRAARKERTGIEQKEKKEDAGCAARTVKRSNRCGADAAK
jgi:hypothetical protein